MLQQAAAAAAATAPASPMPAADSSPFSNGASSPSSKHIFFFEQFPEEGDGVVNNKTQSTSDDGVPWQLEPESEAYDKLNASILKASLTQGSGFVEMRHTTFEDGLKNVSRQGKAAAFHSSSSTMTSSSSSLRQRTNLPFYRERRLNQHDSESHLAKKWRAQREEAWAELEVKFHPLFKTFFYEMLPSFIAAPVVMAIDGVSHARDRAFWPLRPFRILTLELTIMCAVFGLIYWKPEGLSALDAGTLLMLWTAKSLTIAFKYSFYGYRDLYGEYGIGSEAYETQQKRGRLLLGNIVFNLTGLQGIGLFEQLYSSALIQDVDLGRLHFDVAPETAHQVWDEVKLFLWEICPRKDKDKCDPRKLQESQSKGSLVGTTILENEVKPSSDPPSNPPTETAHTTFGAGLRRGLSRLVEPESSEEKRHFGSKYELESAQMDLADGLVEIFLGEGEEGVLQRAAVGQLSAALVALHCVVSSHMLRGRIRFMMFYTPLACSFLIGLLPLMINHLAGEPSCFATTEGTIVFVSQYVAMGFFFFNIFYFTFAPLKFFWNQRRVDAYLYGMLAGDLAVRAIWPPVFVDFSPRIDVELPTNVAAWAAVQRVIRGSHFAPTFQKRFNFYRVITFSVLVMDSLFHSFVSIAYPNLDATGSRVSSTVRLLILTAAVVGELTLGMLVNNFSDRHAAYLGKMRTSNTAMATQGVEEGHREDLLASEHLLDTCMQEIEKDKLASPVTVAFFAAEIARVSLLLSVVGVIIYQDLQSMMDKFGFNS